MSRASLAVRHLLDLGHESVGFVGDPKGNRPFSQRVLGARASLAEAGLDPIKSLIEVSVPGIGIQDGVLAAKQLLTQALPGGILCGNDMMAFGVYRGLTSAGVRIPEDVALIGYDDVEFAANWVLPLTSVRQPTDNLGYRAAQLLLEHTMDWEGHVHQQVVLQPELIVRASSDPRAR